MRRAVRTLVPITLAIAVVTSAQLAGAGKPARKLLTYEQVFGGVGAPAPAVLGPMPAIQGWQDEDHYFELRLDPADKQMKTYAVSVADGAATLQPEPAGGRGALSVPGGRWTVAPRNGTLVATDTRTRTTRLLTAIAGEVKNPRLSPNGKWVAYTRGNNLFAYDLENGVEHQYTTDGSDDDPQRLGVVGLHGGDSRPRLDRTRRSGGRPTARGLAFMRFDDSPGAGVSDLPRRRPARRPRAPALPEGGRSEPVGADGRRGGRRRQTALDGLRCRRPTITSPGRSGRPTARR